MRTRSRSESGSSPVSVSWLASSVSRNSGLPSVRRYSRSVQVASGTRPVIQVASSPASRRVSAGRLDPLDPVDPVQLGEERPQRVGAVQLVGPVGDDDQHAVQCPLVADQERQQVPAGLVGPVRVLDGQHDRGRLGQPLQQTSTCSNSRARASPASPVASGSPSSGSSRASSRIVPPASRPASPSGPSSRTRSRSTAVNGANGSPSGAEFQAAAGQHPRPRRLLHRGELAEQPGLTHPGLAADEHAGGRAVAHRGQRRPQRGQLVRPAHQRGADRRRAHAFQDAIGPGHFRRVKPAGGHGRKPEPPAPARRFRPGWPTG